MRRAVRLASLVAAIAGVACSGDPGSPGGGPGPSHKTTPVVFAGGTLNAEIASTNVQRDTGLMNRASIAADSGMVFVFGVERTPAGCGFYMVNTHFDLDIAFLGTDKRVINIETMLKETTDVHYPAANCRYAVEARKGWFAAHGVTAGATATFTIPAGVIIDP